MGHRPIGVTSKIVAGSVALVHCVRRCQIRGRRVERCKVCRLVEGGAIGYRAAPDGWWRQFISARPARTGKLAVVRADGRPHVAPVWCDLDGDDIVFMTSADTIKGKAILRDGRVALCFDDERPPFSFVTITGTATTSTDSAELLAWATRIGGRYMGADRADAYGRRNAVPPEMVVRVRIDNVVAVVNVADPPAT